ncbi:MAG: hypothetical protein HXY21_11985 [Parvularculaceae bacterium]|nr:hypothetical protein [Parvularculaceae bacterium]
MMRFLDARRSEAPALPGLDDDHVTRALVAAAFFTVAMFVVTLPASAIDARTIDGDSVWLKPQKFNVSLSVHFLTLAILAQQPPRSSRRRSRSSALRRRSFSRRSLASRSGRRKGGCPASGVTMRFQRERRKIAKDSALHLAD